MALERIDIQKEFGFGELESRLRNVKLKGFPNVKAYADSAISVKSFTPEAIDGIFTPQPAVYSPFMDRIKKMAELFSYKGIDIFSLEGGVDYLAYDENSAETMWTIVPPVVEVHEITSDSGGLNYEPLIGEELRKAMAEKGHTLNPQLRDPKLSLGEGKFSVELICDGSHRIHTAYMEGGEQNILVLGNPVKGYPYYAVPQPYSQVEVFAERPPEGTKGKIHVLTEPGHKLLYRLFPSGGILSGDVRTEKKPQ